MIEHYLNDVVDVVESRGLIGKVETGSTFPICRRSIPDPVLKCWMRKGQGHPSTDEFAITLLCEHICWQQTTITQRLLPMPEGLQYDCV